MTDYFVIDTHVHTYKTPEIGLQALSGLDVSGCCGTPGELVPIMRQSGISKAVQCNMTPAHSMLQAGAAKLSPDDDAGRRAILEKITARIIRRNEWTCQMAREYTELVPFVSLDPIMGQAAMVDELRDKIENQGACGLKIHPGEGHFFPDDKVLMPVYKILQDHRMPLISHSGPDIVNPDPDYSRPKAFEPVLKAFSGLNVIMAHLGGGFYDEVLEIAGQYPNAYFDTSAALSADKTGQALRLLEEALTDEEAVELIRKIGTERVLFGTDYPWFNPAWDLKRFLCLGFSDDEKKDLLGENARRILRI
jgi:predicted TIM-barrel fold metal-dependent hydrolase